MENGVLMGFNGDSMGFNGIYDDIPSGKHTKSYGKIHHVQWVNPLFLWPFSSSQTVTIITRG